MLFLVLDGHQSDRFYILYCSARPSVKEGKKKHGEKNNGDQTEQSGKENRKEKPKSKKKGKGKKGKKRKGRGKKSNREASEKDKAALKEFFDGLKGTRRLMVRIFYLIFSFSFSSFTFTSTEASTWLHSCTLTDIHAFCVRVFVCVLSHTR